MKALYHDSVSHRMVAWLHHHPTRELTTGQLLAVGNVPIADMVRAGWPLPPAGSPLSASRRSGTNQLQTLLAAGLIERRTADRVAEGLGVISGRVGVHLYRAAGSLADVTIRPSSALRPGQRPGA